MKVPNPPGSGKDIAEGKGVHREVESEGSRMWGTNCPTGKPPAIDNTADGKAAPYIHGEAKDAGATIELVYDLELISDAAENAQVIELPDSDYVLLSEEDIEKEVNEGTA